MFWLLCLTTLTAMASLPIYRFISPIIRNKSADLVARLINSRYISPTQRQNLFITRRTLSTNSEDEGFENGNNVNGNANGKADKKNKQRLYTRTGDNGSSGLFTGERRPKDDAIFEALGTTDELTSAIGFAREFVNDPTVRDELEHIQCVIQDLQAKIATPRGSSSEFQLRRTKWNINHLVDLEEWIDVHSEILPPLKNFILPSGGRGSTSLHMARAICRRAERSLVPLLDEGLELPVLQYLNRLSSYLFTVARVCARMDGHQETIYRRPREFDDEIDDEEAEK